jgi:hypothetical protein
MPSRADRIQALLQRTTNAADRELLMELHQIAGRLDSAGRGFQATSLVSHRTGKGRIDVVWLEQVAQLSPEEARSTAWVLVEAAAVAEAEAMLMRFLEERVGLEPERAAMMLRDFRAYRDEEPGSLVVDEEAH